MKSLQLMIHTYTQNPKFGDAKQFQGELDAAAHKVQLLEAEMHSYQTELVDVIKVLENIKNQSPLINNVKCEKSPSGSPLMSAQVSLSSTSDSINSGQEHQKLQAPDSDSGIYLTAIDMIQTSEWEEEAFDNLLTPSPTSIRATAFNALESYSSDMISMAAGEEFIVIENDQDGWTKVRRVDAKYFEDFGQGFVPTSFIQRLQ